MNIKTTLFNKRPEEITKVILSENDITIEEYVAITRYCAKVEFSEKFVTRVKKSRAIIDKFLDESRLIYGVTTGFGENVRYVIPTKEAELLQKNIVRSHAISVGEPLCEEIVRAIQLQMILNTGRGFSGISFETIDLIRKVLNAKVTPYAPGEGSVGYLGVEGHLTLVLMGEGRAYYNGELMKGIEALTMANLEPITLKCKEGLSLLNGSTSVTGISVLALYDSIVSAKTIDYIGCLAYEALDATILACDRRLHSVKQHSEQQETAQIYRKILSDSEVMEKHKYTNVQDPLVLRSVPQMHGAGKRIIKQAYENIWEEVQSVSDNPIIYPGLNNEDDVALMGGNFDGSYVGCSADMLCIASGVLAKLSERRTDRMTNRFFSNLPAFLVKNPGLNNGYMIAQYTSAGLVSEIRSLSFPSSVDSISTSANQEDPVSMAYTAATKAYKVAHKLQYILAIELMIALQAIDLSSENLKLSTTTNKIYSKLRKLVPTVDEDRYFEPDIEIILEQIKKGELIDLVEKEEGKLPF